MPEPSFLTDWPGKSAPAAGGMGHPAVYHMLDVAAVAEVLLRPDALAPERRDLFALLAGLHDLGKIGAEFRAMLREGRRQTRRHWEVTELWLRRNEGLLLGRLGGEAGALRALAAACAGHHGQPPSAVSGFGLDDFARMERAAGPEAARDARAAIEALLGLWPGARLDMDVAEAQRLSWWLSGLVTAADWVGSNPHWFPPVAAGPAPAAYLESARARAEAAVEAAGLVPGPVRDGTLFGFALRPMQAAAARLPLRAGPMLAILEDETGSGKTEAALILAQRMLRAGKGRGLFVALPTMATADAMFARLRDVAGRLFEAPSLTLAHGRAGLSVPFRDLRGQPSRSDDATCAPWLADGRRRALLAQIGVGTVDQALLAVLPTRFATLRQWGLASKILIVDEVHEMGQPYMAEELAALLGLHAARGGSAILLTATLPLDLRARLSAAFEEGAGRAAVPDHDPAYPSLSVPGHAALRDRAPPSAKGPVAVRRLASTQEALDLLSDAARDGAACVWIRNAVDEAIAGVAALRGRDVPAMLLHARFALGDRKRHEAAALARFGKEGVGREGHVLVATQVVESSLDLDFDVMISDLAPMAALIQRAGRLWRHLDRRPVASRPVPAPILHVLSPDPARVDGPHWAEAALGRGAFVYPVSDLWRTAEALGRAGTIAAPHGLRGLIEAVHGEGATPVPPALEAAERATLGAGHAERHHARTNLLDIAAGYRSSKGFDDADYPTRLGEPVRTLALARLEDGCLRPWAEAADPAEAWALSEVAASARRLKGFALPDQAGPAIAEATRDWPDWRRRAVTVCPVAEDGTICAGLRYEAETGLMLS
ncbi:CRISPR-associated helicase Cas3' [Rubellimicrobium sp. CFH 75288]|uniref:CRISPR-associated helicase Cas3' n=1 Tax=Rubellimicrobium sp. CFH 75288 TaxID=2697034 RepID=UPI00141237DE|nr:CRISPR-associated helicase Cas3' [Rubellimicrobium sp. CFH 75288]NAZ36457.1 CRISPR-associated helicase Cas3' [Rubellimicrobium sp. CFH 75288]